jgi:hypothetical protein
MINSNLDFSTDDYSWVEFVVTVLIESHNNDVPVESSQWRGFKYSIIERPSNDFIGRKTSIEGTTFFYTQEDFGGRAGDVRGIITSVNASNSAK